MVLDAQSLEIGYLKTLILSDQKAGHLNQSIAFCKLKGLDYDIVDIKNNYKFLTYIFDFLRFYPSFLLPKIPKKRYKAVVSAGSATYYLNKALSKKLKVKSVAIMLPKGFRYKDFDYIVAQSHDNPPNLNNIITIPVNLSYIDDKTDNKIDTKDGIGIVIGGDNKIFSMQKDDIKRVLDEIFTKFPHKKKFVTTSRRTPKEIEELIESYDFDYKIIYSKTPDINPIPYFLKSCRDIYVTMDSTSMLSEIKANSSANLHIIELESKIKDTKYHKLAKNVEQLKGKFDYKPYLERINL